MPGVATKEIQKDPQDPFVFTLDSEHEDIQYIASRLPGYNFRGVPAFFDIGGITQDHKAFQKVADLFIERYKTKNLTSVAGFDSRGFLFGPIVALALGIPFFMLRKKGKLPGVTMVQNYGTEYSDDSLCIPCNAVRKGDRVLLIDDLIATGGTLIAGSTLIHNLGGIVAECALVVGIDGLRGWANLHNPERFFNDLAEKETSEAKRKAWMAEAQKAAHLKLTDSLKHVPVFLMIDACKTPSMPPGSTETISIPTGTEEAQRIQHALAEAPSGAVLIRHKDGTYTHGIPGADGKFNQAYLESET